MYRSVLTTSFLKDKQRQIQKIINIDERFFFKWLNIVFNRVDHKRIELVGPDRVCAEWLLRNGAAIHMLGANSYLKDYNALPGENHKFHIQKIDATDSSISHYGFLHFRGCNYIESLKLVSCDYIEDGALVLLKLLSATLTELEISNCGNISDQGLTSLMTLKNLKQLELKNLPYVKDPVNVTNQLKLKIPNCNIKYDHRLVK